MTDLPYDVITMAAGPTGLYALRADGAVFTFTYVDILRTGQWHELPAVPGSTRAFLQDREEAQRNVLGPDV
jgi:hypothetical protein